MPQPTIGDLEYFERMANIQDSIGIYNSVAAPAGAAVIVTSAALGRGVYEIRLILRITTGANATVTPDNYEIRVGATSKRRIIHSVLGATSSLVTSEMITKVRVPEGSTVSVNAVAAEVAAMVVSASMSLVEVGDYLV